MKKTRAKAEADRAPATGPRLLHIVWAPGEEAWIENEAEFALWEIAAVLARLAEGVERRLSDRDEEEEEDDD
jgi:hypothetical protein